MTATIAFTSVTLCLECSITRGDVTETHSYEEVKYGRQLEFEVTVNIVLLYDKMKYLN